MCMCKKHEAHKHTSRDIVTAKWNYYWQPGNEAGMYLHVPLESPMQDAAVLFLL